MSADPKDGFESAPRVVVVDDDPLVLAVTRRLLQRAGYEVIPCDHPRTALREVVHSQPFALVADLHMPDLSGLDVQLFLARDRVPVPVIILTGHETAETRARLMARGATACLRKPVDDKLLLAAIDDAIRSASGV